MTTLTAAAPPSGGAMVPPGQRLQAATESGLTPADFLRILRQRLVLIIILWIVFSGIAVAFTGFMVKYFPKYTANALIEVKSVTPVNPLDPFSQQRITRREEVEELLASQALLAVAPKVLADTVQDSKVRGTKWFAWAETQKDEAKEDLLDDIISAGPIRDSNFLSVRAAWRNPEDLPKIINTLVDKYLAEVDRMQRAEMRTTQDQLESEISRALSRLSTKNAEIEKARASGDMVGVVRDTPAPNERLLTLIALVTELEVETLGRKSQWDALQNSNPEQLPITPDMQAIIAADPRILAFENKLMMAEEALEATSDRFGSEHKMVRNARSARDRAELMVRQERSLKLVRLQAELIEQARRNWLEAQDQLLVLKEKLQTAMAEQRDKDKKFASYLRMMEDRELLKLQYEEMLKQKDHLAMLLGQKKSVQIALRSPAQIPKRRSSPSWMLWVPGGSFLGLMFACGIALLLDLADKSVRTPRDVSRVPVLGMIPTADDDEIEIERVETAGIYVPHSMIAESFRNIRASIFFT
ncbi:MAG: hypothetical protein K8R46_01910, partial [Pirellulales bacterium]|nr:hypothetical protein [Pirellulales bacterium]